MIPTNKILKTTDDFENIEFLSHKESNDLLVSENQKLENRYCRVIEECIEKNGKIADMQKTIDLYKSREKNLIKTIDKISRIIRGWKSNRISRDYQTLLDIKKVLGGE